MSFENGFGKTDWPGRLHDGILRLVRHRQGNVAVIFGLSMVPMLFLCGLVLDYASTVQRRTQLNAAADAAALAAVSAALMAQSTSQAIATATNMFNAKASTIAGVAVSAPTVTVTQTGLARTATDSYSGSSNNIFATLLGHVGPFQSNVGPNLQSCASSGLYFSATTDDDITSALTTLFSNAVQSVQSHLSNGS